MTALLDLFVGQNKIFKDVILSFVKTKQLPAV